MPGAGMAGLPMPPAMMMPGPRQGALRPMGGPARMPGLSLQPGMPHPPHIPHPRPMHQVSPLHILNRALTFLPMQLVWGTHGFSTSLGPHPDLVWTIDTCLAMYMHLMQYCS